MIAAPLAGYIPLAALAGVLAVVAWNMAEKHEFAALVRGSRADAAIVLVTFLLVVFRDLTEGIVVGFAMAGLVFVKRMSDMAGVHPLADAPVDAARDDLLVYRLSGPFFFGAAAQLGSVLDRIADVPRSIVVDFTAVPLIDSSGARSLGLLARKVARRGGRLWFTGTSPEIRRVLLAQGLDAPEVEYLPDMAGVEAVLAQDAPQP